MSLKNLSKFSKKLFQTKRYHSRKSTNRINFPHFGTNQTNVGDWPPLSVQFSEWSEHSSALNRSRGERTAPTLPTLHWKRFEIPSRDFFSAASRQPFRHFYPREICRKRFFFRVYLSSFCWRLELHFMVTAFGENNYRFSVVFIKKGNSSKRRDFADCFVRNLRAN